MKNKLTMIAERPDGKRIASYLAPVVAWHAAQGAARNSHCLITLQGTRGTATFDSDGSGTIRWNCDTIAPTHLFSPNTIVNLF